MAHPSTDATGTQSRNITEQWHGRQRQAVASSVFKVYVTGTTPGVRVPMREVLLTSTRLPGGGEEANPPPTTLRYQRAILGPDLHP